jgi:hypothetical protein
MYDGPAINDVLHLERYLLEHLTEDAVVGKTTIFAGTEGNHRAQRFFQNRVRGCGGH